MPSLLIEDIIEPFPMYRRTPLSVKEPELATEWDFERNRPWGPEDFSYGSNANVWWQCPKDKQRHRWRATISNRTTTPRSGCPYCYFESYGLNLRQFPQVLKFFDKEKNTASPYKIPIGKKIFWLLSTRQSLNSGMKLTMGISAQKRSQAALGGWFGGNAPKARTTNGPHQSHTEPITRQTVHTASAEK